MARSEGKSGQSGGDPGKCVTHAARTVPQALPADLERALRHLDDAQLDRFRDAVAAEARRRGRPDGKTSERRTRRRLALVTPGQERLVLAAFESGVKPAVIAREFRLSRDQVESVIAAVKPGRR